MTITEADHGNISGRGLRWLRPACELMFVDFIGVCLDEPHNQVGRMNTRLAAKPNSLVLRAACGAGIGSAAQHFECLEALLHASSGLKSGHAQHAP